jgi:hypothetical protein
MTPNPFPHLALDGLFPPSLLRQAHASWPAADWPGWLPPDPRFRGRRQDPRAPLPPPCGELLGLVAALPVAALLGLPAAVPDLGLWGGGLHESGPGDSLPRHLDADRHPVLGLARVASAALYVHPEWQEGWGGDLLLGDGAQSARPGARIAPLPGRLVAFACADDAWHAVAPVTGPAPRRSLALFWYAPTSGPGRRPRAYFPPG